MKKEEKSKNQKICAYALVTKLIPFFVPAPRYFSKNGHAKKQTKTTKVAQKTNCDAKNQPAGANKSQKTIRGGNPSCTGHIQLLSLAILFSCCFTTGGSLAIDVYGRTLFKIQLMETKQKEQQQKRNCFLSPPPPPPPIPHLPKILPCCLPLSPDMTLCGKLGSKHLRLTGLKAPTN